VSHTVIECALG